MMCEHIDRRRCAGFAIAALALFAASSAGAATAPEVGLSKTQVEKIRTIGAELDAKIAPVLKSDEKLSKALRGDLVRLAALKSDAERRTAVAAYQQKYLPAYAGVLKKAGVDLNQVAKALQAVIPDVVFRALPNLVIEGRLHKLATAHPLPAVGGKSSKSSPTFVDRKTLGCGLIAGSDATFTSSSITNNAFAAVAGGCSNHAEKSADLGPPSGAAAVQLEASAKLAASAFAAAIGGTTVADGSITLYAVSGASPLGNRSDVSALLLAPILWSGYAEDFIDAATVVADVPVPSSDNSLRILTRTFAMALLPGVATASANATQIDATLRSQF